MIFHLVVPARGRPDIVIMHPDSLKRFFQNSVLPRAMSAREHCPTRDSFQAWTLSLYSQ